MRRRLLLVSICAVAFTVGMAGPALAHGGGTADATNFRSEVDRVIEGNGSSEDAPPTDVPGVEWRVRALDAYLEVTNTTAQELVVPGYEGEPYLRISRDRVLENQNSPAVYLNNDRFAQTPIPPGVGGGEGANWVEVATGPTYRWHDHRIHWMAQTLPPQAKTDPSTAHVVQNWSVPFTFGGEQFATQGTLRWVPPRPWWPMVLAALALTVAPFLVVFGKAPGEARGRAFVKTGAALVLAIAALDVVHAIDDVVAVPASLGENLYALVQSAAYIGIATFGAIRGWRGGDGSLVALGVGAAALFVGIGLTHTSSLSSSQVATLMPPGVTRLIVATNLAFFVPVAVVLALETRRPAAEPEPSSSIPSPAEEPA